MKLDQIDLQILHLLQTDGRITNSQLAREVGLSPAPTLERVKKLETLGYIEGYYARLNATKMGLGVTTFLSIKLSKHNEAKNKMFIDQIKAIEEVVECHYITGSSDYLLKVVAKSIEDYQSLILNKIAEIEEIDNMQTMVILSTIKDARSLPIPNLE